MHIRNILKKGYSLFCYLQLYFRWYNKVVTERLKYNRKVLDMNIAAYCRVSTDKADQLNSLEAQKQFFSEYTQRTGDNLVRLYADEGISGTKIKNRKEFLRMMADAEHGLFDMVVVKDISRFARNTVDLLQNVRKLKALGIETQFLTANMTSMGNSEFVLTIFGALAQEESANTSKRVKFGKKMNAEKGRVPNIVYGYDKTIGDYFNLAINEEEAAVIRQIYKWYIEEGYGAAKIANMLNAKGIRTKRNCQWSQNATCRILTNELYTGKIINGKQEVADFLTGQRTEKDETEWMVTERPELRIIEPEMYEKAQEILECRSKTFKLTKERQSNKYLFSTLIKCKECGWSFRRTVRTYKNTYIRWVCSGHNGRGADSCPNAQTVDEEELIEVLSEYFSELLKAKKLSLSTAESCTGGGIAPLITSVPGSSEYFNGSIVAYSNEIKMSLLHVSAETLEKHGAVSRETVTEMVKGAMKTLKTDCAVATSGIAGPGGGTPEKPVGTVWIAAAYKNEIVSMKQEGDEGRKGNVEKTIQNALLLLYEKLK